MISLDILLDMDGSLDSSRQSEFKRIRFGRVPRNWSEGVSYIDCGQRFAGLRCRFMIIRWVVVILLCFIRSVAMAAPVGDVLDQFYRYTENKNKTFEPHLPGEVIDHFTGNLTIVQEDMSFPGKAGLDVRIIRTYSSKIWGRSDVVASRESLLSDKERSPIGFGWSNAPRENSKPDGFCYSRPEEKR